MSIPLKYEKKEIYFHHHSVTFNFFLLIFFSCCESRFWLDDTAITNGRCAYLSLELAFLLVAVVGEDLEGRTPLLQLHLPVEHDTGGHNDKVGTPYACTTTTTSPWHLQAKHSPKHTYKLVTKKHPHLHIPQPFSSG